MRANSWHLIKDGPTEVEQRNSLGHWEGDTIAGKNHQGVLISLVERKSRYTVLGHGETKQQHPVAKEIVRCIRPYQKTCDTITYDNGREFTAHEKMAKKLEVDVYFAHPYSSWERGTNENTNGLIRQFYPKKTSLKTVNRKTLQLTIDRLNHRPRKTLNWRTPHEVLNDINTTLTVALNS